MKIQVLFVFAGFFFLNLNALSAEPLDRILAVVEDRVVTLSEVMEYATPFLERLKQSGDVVNEVDFKRVQRKILDDRILKILRNRAAGQMGIRVTDAEIQRVMANLERENGLPPGALPKVLVQQGRSLKGYQRQLRDEILENRLIMKAIQPLVKVSEEEVRDLYRSMRRKKEQEEIHLGQLFFHLPPSSSPQQRQEILQRARDVADLLRNGGSLMALASQYSDDSDVLKGGDMGWFRRGQLLPSLEERVFDLDEKSVSDPILTPQGYYIFQLLERRTVSEPSKPKSAPKPEVHARHILIKTAENVSREVHEAARKQLLTIRHQIMQGDTSFESMARTYSEDSTAADGGDLGWFARGIMVPAFEKVAFSLDKGMVSQPVRSPYGWHLILSEGKRTLDPDSLEAHRETLTSRIRETKTRARYRQWLRDLRRRHFVEYR